jgi:primary-amine oxidase
VNLVYAARVIEREHPELHNDLVNTVLVKAHPEWQAAIARRGITNVDDIFCAPLAPGYFGREDEIGRRMIRSLTFLRDKPTDSPWAHPVEGLLVTIDLTKGEVVRVQDEGDVPTPTVSGNYDVDTVGPARETLRPIEITQPEGPSFSVNGSLVEWENWKFRVSFNSREGLVLNQVSFTDKGEERSVLYRASVPEMVVPYGDTSTNRFWISYFDAGEYLLGKNANPLTLGCDCLGVIHYFDGVAADDHGHPMVVGQAVCMHEEDFGILWKHTDLNGTPDSRRSRRFVISYFATVGVALRGLSPLGKRGSTLHALRHGNTTLRHGRSRLRSAHLIRRRHAHTGRGHTHIRRHHALSLW